jgi:hypothetical protein
VKFDEALHFVRDRKHFIRARSPAVDEFVHAPLEAVEEDEDYPM